MIKIECGGEIECKNCNNFCPNCYLESKIALKRINRNIFDKY